MFLRVNAIVIIIVIFLLTPSISFGHPQSFSYISVSEYTTLSSQYLTLDVRSKESRGRGRVTLAHTYWIDPYNEEALATFINITPADTPCAIFCTFPDDYHSEIVAESLSKNGFKEIVIIKGGWDAIRRSGIEVFPQT